MLTQMQIERAITDIFSDMSNSKKYTLNILEEIASHVEGYIDALKHDLEKEES